MPDTKVPSPIRARAKEAKARAIDEKRWRPVFLAHLAASSNVSAAARQAVVATSTVYEARRRDPGFYREWQVALCEGYEHLEMALVQRLREGEIKPASGAKKGVRVFDNATALRLLVAHREAVTRQQGVRENHDAASILARIDARIERLRDARVIEHAPAGPSRDDDDD